MPEIELYYVLDSNGSGSILTESQLTIRLYKPSDANVYRITNPTVEINFAEADLDWSADNVTLDQDKHTACIDWQIKPISEEVKTLRLDNHNHEVLRQASGQYNNNSSTFQYYYLGHYYLPLVDIRQLLLTRLLAASMPHAYSEPHINLPVMELGLSENDIETDRDTNTDKLVPKKPNFLYLHSHTEISDFFNQYIQWQYKQEQILSETIEANWCTSYAELVDKQRR